MIQTWIADVTPLLEKERYEAYYRQLPKWRQKKADRARQALNRAQSVGAWTLYESMRKMYGLSDDAVYNLSHSGRYALCAVETDLEKKAVKLGCDVEMVKDFHPGIVKRFFCPAEEEYILSYTDPEKRKEAFYRYWVLKESFIKATREGMKQDLRSFEIAIEEGAPRLIRQPEEWTGKYYYKEYQPGDADAKIAVCSTDPEFGELRITEFSGR